MHQLKCNIIHVDPLTLIEMKRKGQKGSLHIYIINIETSFKQRVKAHYGVTISIDYNPFPKSFPNVIEN